MLLLSIGGETLQNLLKYCGIGGVAFFLVIVIFQKVINEKILKQIPEGERTSIIKSILIIVAVISIIGLIGYLALEWKKTPSADMFEDNVSKVDSSEYRKTYSSYKLSSSNISGGLIDEMISNPAKSSTIDTLYGAKTVFNTYTTKIYDTINKFREKYSYAFKSTYGDEDNYIGTYVMKGNKRIKTKKIVKESKFPAADPNLNYEFAFTCKVKEAISFLGFSKNSFSIEKIIEEGKEVNTLVHDRNSQTYLEENGLRWIMQYLLPRGNGKNSSDIYNDDFEALQFYCYILNGKIPEKFILLSLATYEDSGCGEGANVDEYSIRIVFSTPRISISTIAIKNISSNPFTINKILFETAYSQHLRMVNEVTTETIRSVGVKRDIKVEPGSAIIIPVGIFFSPINDTKNITGVVNPMKTGDAYFYGDRYAIDSIQIEGYEFDIAKGIRDIALVSFSNGHTFSEEASCPFIYSFNKENLYQLENHILYKKDAIEKEGNDTLLLKNRTTKFILKEVEEETSFIDLIFLLVKEKNGVQTVYKSENEKLKSKDKDYLTLNTGDELLIDFPSAVVSEGSECILVANGYYQRLNNGKRNKKAPNFLKRTVIQ